MSADDPTAASDSPWGEEERLDADPIRQFTLWLDEARERSGLPNPNAMTLATATADGEPSARIVLLKSHGPDGFVFFANYESDKGRVLDGNPRAALVFHWDALGRQVRVRGRVGRVEWPENERYFHTRPRSSQLGAWASRQSAAIGSRDALIRAYEEAERRYAGGPVPLPPFWGGYVVVPERIEFWIGRDHRLHDRFVYTRDGGGWRVARLSP
jgi:pyridoxamine 5'-phosphate oxidase